MAEDGCPVPLNVFVPSDTVANLGQHRSEGGFADIERITSEVVAALSYFIICPTIFLIFYLLHVPS